MRRIVLSSPETKIVKYLGSLRNSLSMASKTNLRRDPEQNDREMHIQAMGAELAVAKWLNVYPDLSPTNSVLPTWDMVYKGRKVEVKRRDRTNLDLLVIEPNYEAMYILVYGKLPEFFIVGMIDGGLVEKIGRWMDLPYGPCWVVDRDLLMPAA